MSLVGRAWQGNEKLWKVFWLYGILFPVVVGLLIGMAIGLKNHASEVPHWQMPHPMAVGINILWYLYLIWLDVSLWRCAFNAHWTVWGYILRVIVAIAFFGLILRFVFLGLFGGLASLGSMGIVSSAPHEAPGVAPGIPSNVANPTSVVECRAMYPIYRNAMMASENVLEQIKLQAQYYNALKACKTIDPEVDPMSLDYKDPSVVAPVAVPTKPVEQVTPVNPATPATPVSAPAVKRAVPADCQKLANAYNQQAATPDVKARRMEMIKACESMN